MFIELHAQLKLSEVYGFCLAHSRPTLFYTFPTYKHGMYFWDKLILVQLP